MLNARSRTANRTTAGRWTVAAALLASAVTVLAACSGSATGDSAPESSAPVIRGNVGNVVACTPTSTVICAVAGANANEVNVSWIGTGTGFIVQYQKPGSSGYRNPAGSCANAITYLSAALQCTATSVPTGTNKFRVAPYRNGGAGTYSSWKSVSVIGAPGAPVIGAATVTGETTATVAFTAPTSNGGAAITRYTATSSPAGGSGTLEQAGSGIIDVTGLLPGTAYTFTVTASNSSGTSVASAASGPVTTISGSNPPLNVTAIAGPTTEAGLLTAVVTFEAPEAKAGSTITRYTATSAPDGIIGIRNGAASGNINVTGLTLGKAYTFTVTATDSNGNTSLASNPSGTVTPRFAVTATAGPSSGEAVVSWSPGTASAVGYVVYFKKSGNDWENATGLCEDEISMYSTATQCVASGLTPGAEYRFSVKAWLGGRRGMDPLIYSNAVTVPTGLPTASSGSVSATAGTGSRTIVVDWTEVPGAQGYSVLGGRDDGSTPIYMSLSGGCGSESTFNTTVTQCTDNNFNLNERYGFQVIPRFVNAATSLVTYGTPMFTPASTCPGGSTSSSCTTSTSVVTATTVPGAPSITTVTNTQGKALVFFTAPSSNGGSTITGYNVSWSPSMPGSTATCTSTCIVEGLMGGISYTFKMTATNTKGDSAASAGYLHLFKGLPAAPEIANVVQGSAGTGTATISFIPGLEGGGTVSAYTVMSTPGDKSVTVGASAGTVTVTGLTVGTQYTFTMKATNEYGDSVNSAGRTFTAS